MKYIMSSLFKTSFMSMGRIETVHLGEIEEKLGCLDIEVNADRDEPGRLENFYSLESLLLL